MRGSIKCIQGSVASNNLSFLGGCRLSIECVVYIYTIYFVLKVHNITIQENNTCTVASKCRCATKIIQYIFYIWNWDIIICISNHTVTQTNQISYKISTFVIFGVVRHGKRLEKGQCYQIAVKSRQNRDFPSNTNGYSFNTCTSAILPLHYMQVEFSCSSQWWLIYLFFFVG